MMYDLSWKIKIVDVGWKLEQEMFIFRRGINNGKTELMQPDGTIISVSEGDGWPAKPFMSLDKELMQSMSDELAKKGIKPQQGFLEGKLEGVEKHLKDMRTLVFKKKKRNEKIESTMGIRT